MLLVISAFGLVRAIPGDPGAVVAGFTASTAEIKSARHALGLDQPLGTQFVHYLGDLVHGRLGTSFQEKRPVTQIIRGALAPSAQLAGFALAIVMLVGIPIGMIVGALTRDNRRRKLDLAFSGITSILGAIPEFLMATLLAFVFAVELRLLPVAGASGFRSLILPALAVSLLPTAVLARIVRVETLNVISQDYIRTARSKRLPERLVFMRHVLPNVVTAALTIGGLLFSGLVGSAVIVENVFARPGLGTELTNAILNRDYPLIQGMVLFFGLLLVLVNGIVDVALALVDRRSLAGQS